MSLAHAILGLLHEQPMTGYDLKTRCFDQSIAHFWPADQAQIYRTLEKMREDGWVRFDVESQESRPSRKVYRLTKSGEAELARWLREETLPLPAIREPFLIQLFLAHHLKDEEARAKLEAQRAQHAARLAAYESVPLPPLGEKKVPRPMRYQRMTLEMGLAYERAMLAWIDQCLASLGGKRR